MTSVDLIERQTGTLSPSGWWERYREAIRLQGLSESARRVIDLDSTFLMERGVFKYGRPRIDARSWPASRVTSGLTVGAVQSGKTASLLAVTAKALDAGSDIVVILAGTRLALWRQTYERTLSQLDGWSPQADSARRLARVFLPKPSQLMGETGMGSLDRLYYESPGHVRHALDRGRPLVVVVMKQVDHLMRFGGYLKEVVESAAPRLDRPIHMLVIDDEADDGSILDAHVETSLSPEASGLKQIPRHIASLWSGPGFAGSTFHSNLYATYLAFTATPQANILQEDHNPLSPRDFVTALRTPGPTGTITPPRRIEFREPLGPSRWYTGGESYYARGDGHTMGHCYEVHDPVREDFQDAAAYETELLRTQTRHLGDALRAFLVGSAMRLLGSGKLLSSLKGIGPLRLADMLTRCPKPSSMLIHPSALIEKQLEASRLVAAWSEEPEFDPVDSDDYSQTLQTPKFSPDGLTARLDGEEGPWRQWFEEFCRKVSIPTDGHDEPAEAFPHTWQMVKQTLVQEIFPNVRLAMINSDPRADDRPRFVPEADGMGTFSPPTDLLTVFVSGNVMSRGITLEGLTTTLFLRSSQSPAADTQMQMQRWFGYRGAYLPWCLVFLYQDQLDLFRWYHENDQALRGEILAEMNRAGDEAPSPLILQGHDHIATRKIANLRALPLCPGAHPFIGAIPVGTHRIAALERLRTLLETHHWDRVGPKPSPWGIVADRQLDMPEVASILEGLSYASHRPSPSGRNHRRWISLEAELELDAPHAPLFRPPAADAPPKELLYPRSCPYSIAAYLRLWNAALTHDGRGLFATDDERIPWSLVPRQNRVASAPRFYLAIRFGRIQSSSVPWLASRDIRPMERAAHPRNPEMLRSRWGSRNPGDGPGAYLGDHLFDYHVSGRNSPAEAYSADFWRPRGEPGLLLLHVIMTPEGESLTAGLAIPAGGPDHFAAIRPAAAS